MKTINKQRLDQLVSKGAFLVDMRSPVDYRNAHIDGAVNLPLKNFTNKLMGMPRTTTIVVYSGAATDPDLLSGLNYAEIMGFTKVHVAEFDRLSE